MATTIKMPQLGESVTEGTIERWLVKEGDTVEQYDPLFEVIRDNAYETETVVDVEVIASSVVRAGDERAEILLFVNRPTTNARTEEPVVYRDQVTVSMQRVDGEWKIDGLTSSPIAG